MAINLYEQFSVTERAVMLLNKYPIPQLRDIINGLITQSRKRNETHACNYWNEVSLEIQRIIKTI
jgi:hypothetical protein